MCLSVKHSVPYVFQRKSFPNTLFSARLNLLISIQLRIYDQAHACTLPVFNSLEISYAQAHAIYAEAHTT